MKKFLNLSRKILESNFSKLKAPYRFTYIVTNKCQLRCNMCNIWKKPSCQELSLPEIREFFQKSNQFSWINLSGGEIFLRKDIFDIVKVIHNNCKDLYLLDFPTNGFETELITDTVKKILSFKMPKVLVTVSLDGPPDIHDQIRGASGAWLKAVETFDSLRKLQSNRFRVFFGITLQPSNKDRFQETVKCVEGSIGKIGYDDFHVNLSQHSSHYYNNVDFSESTEEKALWSQMEEIIKLRKTSLVSPVGFLERRYQGLCRSYLHTKKTPVQCQALEASFFMDPCGDVYPCSIFNKQIGNIKDFDYDTDKLWEANSRKEVRNQICKGDCPQCWTPCEAYQSILADMLHF